MKFVYDDEHFKTDFGYNRLTLDINNVWDVEQNNRNNSERAREMDKVYHETNKEQMLAYNEQIVDCDVCGKSLRRESLTQHQLSMTCKPNFNHCELCGNKVSYKTKDKHINSA